jgi:hypothetical protein
MVTRLNSRLALSVTEERLLDDLEDNNQIPQTVFPIAYQGP